MVDRLVVGAGPGADLIVEGAGLAARHLELSREEGAWRARALDGALEIDGEGVDDRALRGGEELVCGKCRMRLSRDSSERVELSKDARQPRAPRLAGGAEGTGATEGSSRFELLLQMARTVGSDVGHEGALDRLMEIVFCGLSPERAVLAIAEGDGRLRFEAARHARLHDPWRDLQVSGTILRRVIDSGEAFITADAVAAEEIRDAHSIASQRIRSALCVPFHWRGLIGGALYVDHRGSPSYFDEDDLDFLIVLSQLATVAVQNVRDYQAIRAENQRLRAQALGEGPLIGDSPAIAGVRRLIDKVSRSDQPVLILGERGTGKELVARAIHDASSRQRFVAVNCAAIPESLTEGALFGHEKGAFTGADRQHRGFFEQASGGTLFLDEIGDLKSPAQAAILRALQEGEVRRVGSLDAIAVDARIIAATNRELSDDEFRPDLRDRIDVLQIELPPLRERVEDIPLLASHFAGDRVRRISAKALAHLRDYSWPGNVRELRNVIERAIVMGDGKTIWPEDLPPALRAGQQGQYHLVSLEDVERDHITRVLRHTRGNVSRAADILGIRRITIYKKLRKYGLEPKAFKE